MKARQLARHGFADSKQMRRAVTQTKRELGAQLPRWADWILEDFVQSYHVAVTSHRNVAPVAWMGAWATHRAWSPACDCQSRMRASRVTGRRSERCLRWIKRCRKHLVQIGVLEVIEPSRQGGRRRGARAPGRANGYGPGRLLRAKLGVDQGAEPERSRPVPLAVLAPVGAERAETAPSSSPAPSLAPDRQPSRNQLHGPNCACERCTGGLAGP